MSATDEHAFVNLKNVDIIYGDDSSGVKALEGTNLHVEKGSFIAVVGPSGCGKSSLMRLVTGLIPPSAGTIKVANKPVNGPLKIAGMAFQNPTLLPWRNTLDNVMLPLEIVDGYRKDLKRDRLKYEEKAYALLETVGLKDFAMSAPHELSGGMKQRVSLCRALMHEPQLLMLDEPFAALDAFTREELWGVLQKLWMEQRFTVILVTHDLREAIYLSQKIYVMSSRPGKIVIEKNVEFDFPRSLSDTYKPDFVALVEELRNHISLERQ